MWWLYFRLYCFTHRLCLFHTMTGVLACLRSFCLCLISCFWHGHTQYSRRGSAEGLFQLCWLHSPPHQLWISVPAGRSTSWPIHLSDGHKMLGSMNNSDFKYKERGHPPFLSVLVLLCRRITDLSAMPLSACLCYSMGLALAREAAVRAAIAEPEFPLRYLSLSPCQYWWTEKT